MVRTTSAAAANDLHHVSTQQGDHEDERIEDGGARVPVPSAFSNSLERFRHVNHEDQIRTRSVTRRSPLPKRNSTKRTFDDADHNSSTKPSSSSASPSPAKRRRRESSKYAPPSKYAHLPPLHDILAPNLICIFVGTNPGVRTATAGHAYAHPSNLFWKLLHSSGCTDVRLAPSQDVDLPRLYSMGNTNIVARPSKDAGELSKAEMAAGTPILEEKARKWRPEAVCIVGKGIWEAVWRWRYGREIKKAEFRYGWQEEGENFGKAEREGEDQEGSEWEGARVFVTTSTSGLSASTRPWEKEEIWRPFGEWVKKRRKERLEDAGAA